MKPDAEGAWKVLEAAIGARRRRPRSLERVKPHPYDLRSMLMADLHVPFHLRDEIAAAWRGTDCTRLIIGGDLGDYNALSTFLKYENVDILDELHESSALIDTAAGVFKDVIVMGGNHDPDRYTKRLLERNQSPLIKAIRFCAGGVTNPLEAICSRHANVTYVQHQTRAGVRHWFYEQGDAIVSHRQDYSSVPGAALRRIAAHFRAHHRALRISRDFRVLFQAHTHTVAAVPDGPGAMLYETGCCCGTMDYQTRDDSKGAPQIPAYMTFTQRDGVTDLNSVRHHFITEE